MVALVFDSGLTATVRWKVEFQAGDGCRGVRGTVR
jgi:hypothetical protein